MSREQTSRTAEPMLFEPIPFTRRERVAHGASHMWREFARYLLVGVISFGVDFTVLVALTEVAGLHYLVSGALAFTVGVLINYLLSVTWVFERRGRAHNTTFEFLVYAVIGVTGLGVNQVVLYSLSDILDFHYTLSKLAAGAAVLLWTFFLRRAVLFSGRAGS